MTGRFIVALSLVLACASLLAQTSRNADVQLKAAQYKEQVEGDLKGAITEYEKLVSGKDRTLAAQSLLRIGEIHQRLADGEADAVYTRLIREFSDQPSLVSVARTRLSARPTTTTTTTANAGATAQGTTPTPIVVAADRLMDIAVFDRRGTQLLRVSETAPLNIVSISPDGQRVAYSRTAGGVMVLDVNSRARTQVANGVSPVGWSPDGSRIMHIDRPNGESGIYLTSSFGGGGEDLVLSSPNGIYHWTGDGRFIVAGLGPNFVAVPVAGGDRRPFPFLSQQLGSGPRISPDSRFVAYTSNESGRRGIMVRPLSLDGAPVEAAPVSQQRVSLGDALGMARWRGDSGELYYIGADGSVMAVPVSTGSELTAGTPVRLFRTPPEFPLNNVVGQHADVSADGERFVFLLASAN